MCSSTPRNRFLLARLCGFPLFAATISAPAAVQCYYTWEQIPNPPGWVCYGAAINDHGRVAGNLLNLGENTRGFTWSPETGTRVLPFPNGAYDMTVTDMNDAGLVTGWATSTAQGWFGFVWDGSSYTIIPRPEWATQIRPAAINNAGQVVGTVMNTGFGPAHAFIWENDVLVDVGQTIGTSDSWAMDVNSAGVVTGKGRDTETHAFVADKQLVEWLEQPSGFVHVDAFGISDNGFVVGSADGEESIFRRFAAVWTPWGVEVIEPPAGVRHAILYGINNSGRAVGSYFGGYETAIALQNGVMQDLRPLIVPPISTGFISARDINRYGLIVVSTSSYSYVFHPMWVSGDLSGDCHVGMDDLILVLANFGSPVGTFPRGDVDLDGEVDIADLAVLLSHWGE